MRSAAILLALLACVAVCSAAHAQLGEILDEEDTDQEILDAKTPREKAKAHFKMGVEFYKNMNYTAALIEFKRAYETSPHYKVLFNLGQVSLELHDYVAALDYLNQYAAEGGDDVPTVRLAEVNQMLDRLQGLIASIHVTVNVDDAEVFVDNAPVGRSPIKVPLRVSAGRIKLTALKSGMQLAERHIDVAAGDVAEASLHLNPVQPDEALSASAVGLAGPGDSTGAAGSANVASGPGYIPTAEEASDSSSTATLVMGIVSGGLAIGTGVMTVVTLEAEEKYNDTRTSAMPTSNGRLNDLRNSAKRKAWVTDGLLAATAVSAVTTLILALTQDAESDSDPTVQLSVGLDRVGVGGRF